MLRLCARASRQCLLQSLLCHPGMAPWWARGISGRDWESDPLKGRGSGWRNQVLPRATSVLPPIPPPVSTDDRPALVLGGRTCLGRVCVPDLGYMTLCAYVCLYLYTFVSMGSIDCPCTYDVSLPVPCKFVCVCVVCFGDFLPWSVSFFGNSGKH